MGVVTLTGPKLLCQMLAVVDVGMSERRESQRNFVKEGERENESVRERVKTTLLNNWRKAKEIIIGTVFVPYERMI